MDDEPFTSQLIMPLHACFDDEISRWPSCNNTTLLSARQTFRDLARKAPNVFKEKQEERLLAQNSHKTRLQSSMSHDNLKKSRAGKVLSHSKCTRYTSHTQSTLSNQSSLQKLEQTTSRHQKSLWSTCV